MQFTYRHTRYACYIGYITQAIVNNLSPLLFLIFQTEFQISLTQISLIITLNFAIQMAIDLLSARYADKIGYRISIVAAQIFATLGVLGLSIFPAFLPGYPALLLATAISAIGGGLLEVLVSPLVEALPSDHKQSEMSLLHSFYCWGHMGVVALSTAFFVLFGKENWRWLPIFWAAVPFLNIFLFMKAPLRTLDEQGKAVPLKILFGKSLFWIFLLLMVCAGASELAMSQWSSLFAEMGLQVNKTLGDLLGPCFFAATMGLARLYFGKNHHFSLHRALLFSGSLCLFSYTLTVFSPWPLLSLIGCGLCGLSVGLMWPGVYSLAAEKMPYGGTAMFAILALAGDVGCCAGPTLVGAVSDGALFAGHTLLDGILPGILLPQAALKCGFLAAIIFPLLLIIGMYLLRRFKTFSSSMPPR
ncbi:MAG: MFS transporter [Clostridiales bacterium]|nr:MFS transporter [Clostridiales bacterium]